MDIPLDSFDSSEKPSHDITTETLPDDTVLIAGGGPVGLILANVLARYGVKSIILERNESTTKWPKMDLTKVRSMELLRRLGLVDGIRKLGVPPTTPYRVFMLPGLYTSKPITSWEWPCVNDLKAEIQAKTDGSMALEPWQRISQEVFEKYLKSRCDENPLIDCRFGWKVEESAETEQEVMVSAVHIRSGKKRTMLTKYLVGCDGASSRTRRDMGITLDGGPLPGYTLLVHFRSRDLGKLFKMGRFWHLFVFNEHGFSGAAISQDDEYIFTTHLLLPLDADHDHIDSHDAVYAALGGIGGPFKIDIDEILVRSTYRHSIAVARTYRSRLGKVFLAGDSAHQNIPTGGYGMNMGIGDAFDLGWKLAATLKHNAGPLLLDSYEQERRPVALMSIQQSGVHMEVHMALAGLLGPDPHLVEEDTEEGHTLREKIHKHYQEHNDENTNIGVEMDHRHRSYVYPRLVGTDKSEPPWSPKYYVPSTFPGSRAPHVFLRDGTAIFDLFGEYWTLVEFSGEGTEAPHSQIILDEAKDVGVPLKHVLLCDEDHARNVWQAPLVLVRPDGHVAWRGERTPGIEAARDIVAIVFGQKAGGWTEDSRDVSASVKKPFAATTEVTSQVDEYALDRMGIMQT